MNYQVHLQYINSMILYITSFSAHACKYDNAHSSDSLISCLSSFPPSVMPKMKTSIMKSSKKLLYSRWQADGNCSRSSSYTDDNI